MLGWIKKLLGLDGISDREVYANTPDLQLWRAFDNGEDDKVIRLVQFYKGLIDRMHLHDDTYLNLLEYACLKGSLPLVEFFIEYFYPHSNNKQSIHLALDNGHLHCLPILLNDKDVKLNKEEIQKIQTSVETLEDLDLSEKIQKSLQRHLEANEALHDNESDLASAPPGPQIIWRKALNHYKRQKLEAQIEVTTDKSYKIAV